MDLTLPQFYMLAAGFETHKTDYEAKLRAWKDANLDPELKAILETLKAKGVEIL